MHICMLHLCMCTLGISLLCMWFIFCSRPWVTVSCYAVGQDSSYWNSYLEWPRAELTPWFTWHLVWYGISKGKHTPSARSHTLYLYSPLLHRVLTNWLSDSTWHSLRGEKQLQHTLFHIRSYEIHISHCASLLHTWWYHSHGTWRNYLARGS